MVHRLSVVFVSVAIACSGSSGPGPSASYTTSDPEPGVQQWFAFAVDGVVAEVFATEAYLLRNSGPECDTSWALSLHGYGYDQSIEALIGYDHLPTQGSVAPTGSYQADNYTKALFKVDRGSGHEYVSTEKLTIEEMGNDRLVLRLDGGTICPFPVVNARDDDSSCPTFVEARLSFLYGDVPFEPDDVRCYEGVTSVGRACGQQFTATTMDGLQPPACE